MLRYSNTYKFQISGRCTVQQDSEVHGGKETATVGPSSGRSHDISLCAPSSSVWSLETHDMDGDQAGFPRNVSDETDRWSADEYR